MKNSKQLTNPNTSWAERVVFKNASREMTLPKIGRMSDDVIKSCLLGTNLSRTPGGRLRRISSSRIRP